MSWPESTPRAKAAAAAVVAAFAVGIIVLARSFRTSADEMLSGEVADAGAADSAPRPKRPAGVPLTAKTAVDARELHQALETAFGKNARGLSFITYVDYDPHPDRLHITFALDHADPKRPGAERAAVHAIDLILDAVRDGRMKWTWVLVTGTAQVPDYRGNVEESTVIRAQFSRERLLRPDWPKVRNVGRMAEQYWTYVDLAK